MGEFKVFPSSAIFTKILNVNESGQEFLFFKVWGEEVYEVFIFYD